MGGRRTGYGKREIVTPLSPPTGEDYVTKQTSVQRGYWPYLTGLSALRRQFRSSQLQKQVNLKNAHGRALPYLLHSVLVALKRFI